MRINFGLKFRTLIDPRLTPASGVPLPSFLERPCHWNEFLIHQQLLHMRKNRHFLTGVLLLVTVGLHAQLTQITGKVTDAAGTPVPAATIRLKNSKTGTSADMQGVFNIKAAISSTLIISGIGYETKEVKVSGPSL